MTQEEAIADNLANWGDRARVHAPGRVFLIRDNHPMLFALDHAGLTVVQDYFSGTVVSYATDGSYTLNSAGQIAHTMNHNWAHDLHEVVSVLLAAGLTLEALGEHAVTDWQALPMLTYNAAAHGYVMPPDAPKLPLTFSIVARKAR